jgi:predicted MPP superfamily phosphohydrolase
MRLFFTGFGIFVYTSLCVYIGARAFTFTRYFFPGVKAQIYWPLFILLGYAFVFIGFMRSQRLNFLTQIGSYWMAVFVYLLLLLLLFDTLRLTFFLICRPLSPRLTAFGIGAAFCLCFLIITCGAFHARSIRTVKYNINLEGQGGLAAQGNLRIALISDLHMGTSVGQKHIAKIVNVINKAGPDIVCIAGDIFDGHVESVRNLSGIAAEFRRIQAPLGVYACLGNHDIDRMFPFGGGTDRIEAFLREAGVVLLLDEAAAAGDFYIIGRRDARPIGLKAQRETIDELCARLSNVDEKPRPLIVLDHQPIQYAAIEAAGADLVLSGHTHRGQIFPANLITKRIYKKAGAAHYGYWRGTTLQAVITSGAGYWGPPVRIGTNSEVVVIDVR